MSDRLEFKQNFLDDAIVSPTYAAFLDEVFAIESEQQGNSDPTWMGFGHFTGTGRCVAGLEAAILGIIADGDPLEVAAIRRAGVVEAHRGEGLFLDLIKRALDWCTGQSDGPILLYTETPGLYARFGFRSQAQHAFVGVPPPSAVAGPAEIADPERVVCLVDRLASVRTPISHGCAIVGGSDLLLTNLRSDGDLRTAFAADLDALIVFQSEGTALDIVDVVAAVMPSLAQIVGALDPCRAGAPWTRVRTLFSPDRLGWRGEPELDDTGLMVWGRVPPAMTRPFMLPPTTSF